MTIPACAGIVIEEMSFRWFNKQILKIGLKNSKREVSRKLGGAAHFCSTALRAVSAPRQPSWWRGGGAAGATAALQRRGTLLAHIILKQWHRGRKSAALCAAPERAPRKMRRLQFAGGANAKSEFFGSG